MISVVSFFIQDSAAVTIRIHLDPQRTTYRWRAIFQSELLRTFREDEYWRIDLDTGLA